MKNNENGLFQLTFRYEFGQSADNRYDVANQYLNFIGTDKMTATEVKQKFYELACSFSATVWDDVINISLSGLNENMQSALALLEDVMNHAQVDKQAYDDLVKRILKGREDAKKNQRNYYATLCEYGIYGPRNSYRDIVSEQQLKNTDPQVFVDLVKKLGSYEHSVDYYGPLDVKEVTAIIDKTHQTAKKLQAVPQNNYYVKQVANQNEVWIAPYDAKNIYMRAYHHENRDWKIGEAAVQAVFNEYFGGGMNGIVFQEMREARGLAYNASALYSRPGRKGEKESFYTHIITQNDKMMDCINHFHQIMNELPASENAFNIAKEGLTKQLASLRTTKMGIISKWHSMKELGLDYDLNQRIYEGLGKVTLQDVVNFEKANMADKPLRYLILGDEKELDVKSLEKIGSIRRLTTEEVFGY